MKERMVWVKTNNMPLFYLTIFFLFLPFTLAAQYERYLEFEHLYPGCTDDEESTIYGGTYPDKCPDELNLPIFPGGGDIELTRFVHHNIEYPDVVDSTTAATDSTPAITHRPKGIVYVEVVVDRCGRATRQEVVQSVNEIYDQEALRIMKNMPVFKPGAIDGVRVKVALVIPVYFTRDELKKEKEYFNYDYYENENSNDGNYNYDDYQYDDYNYNNNNDGMNYDDYNSY
jgi:TonB family protein